MVQSSGYRLKRAKQSLGVTQWYSVCPAYLRSIFIPHTREKCFLKEREGKHKTKPTSLFWLAFLGRKDFPEEQRASLPGRKAYRAAAIPPEGRQGATCISSASCLLGAPLQELLAQSLVLSIVRNELQTAVKFKVRASTFHKLSTVAHACNLSTQQAKAGE